MTKKDAIKTLRELWRETNDSWYENVYDMAIEALQTDVVRCKDCIHKKHCHETVAHTKEHDGFREHWSETIEWCSRGERKGGDSE